MASPTDAEILDMYRNALAAVSTGQSYQINGRTLTRADQAEIRNTIDWLEDRIDDAMATPVLSRVALMRFY